MLDLNVKGTVKSAKLGVFVYNAVYRRFVKCQTSLLFLDIEL